MPERAANENLEDSVLATDLEIGLHRKPIRARANTVSREQFLLRLDERRVKIEKCGDCLQHRRLSQPIPAAQHKRVRIPRQLRRREVEFQVLEALEVFQRQVAETQPRRLGHDSPSTLEYVLPPQRAEAADIGHHERHPVLRLVADARVDAAVLE